MIKKPLFSILIPTYNRAELLKATISICLNQSFQDFEIVISDNCSTDETEEIVKSFRDKRIKYFKNKKNIGAEPNMKKVMEHATGEYLFMMGDDDFILFENTLEEIKKIIEDTKFGFIRLNLIERKFIGKGIRKSKINIEHNIKFQKNSSPEKILDFFTQIDVTHIAGLVIKNSDNLYKKMIDCPEVPWIRVIYDVTKLYGAYFLSNHYMVITWSQGEILTLYELRKNNHLMFEDYTDFIFTIIPKERLRRYKLKYYERYIKHQPVIKLYSSNLSLLKFDRRLLELEPHLKYNILFWIYLTISLVTPMFLWRIVRVIQHKKVDRLDYLENRDKIYNKCNALNKKYYAI
ncbi:MAG: glycosyltransferase family 2 protein [Candidatus Levybacteria bacterium]|nr:glycosyltransferase family 2 protein [Candidatus Levybacteria bacterium]